jgi:cell division protein FtsI (penicillin-binding protein 3)
MKGSKCEVAGKTGTAWIYLDPQDKPLRGKPFETENGERKYQATFVGFFPADEPKYTAIVTVYTTLTKSLGYGGGNQPTRIFREIVDHIWAMEEEWGEELKETYNMPYMKETYIGTRQSAAPVPNLIGLGLKDAVYMLENNGYRCTFEGIGHVAKQSIKAGIQEKKGATIHIILK